MCKDFRGTPLKVGDKVVLMTGGSGRILVEGTIMKLNKYQHTVMYVNQSGKQVVIPRAIAYIAKL